MRLVHWTLILPVNNKKLSFCTCVTPDLDKAEKWEFNFHLRCSSNKCLSCPFFPFTALVTEVEVKCAKGTFFCIVPPEEKENHRGGRFLFTPPSAGCCFDRSFFLHKCIFIRHTAGQQSPEFTP
ncbi:hypothetical protein AMECASPLE_022456 [Ameca splendens]|uniref:Uncharacterized protein n=1 Tax=Ameca splendens TaxID=208324 RepID=A0ABV0YEW2_9TELE